MATSIGSGHSLHVFEGKRVKKKPQSISITEDACTESFCTMPAIASLGQHLCVVMVTGKCRARDPAGIYLNAPSVQELRNASLVRYWSDFNPDIGQKRQKLTMKCFDAGRIWLSARSPNKSRKNGRRNRNKPPSCNFMLAAFPIAKCGQHRNSKFILYQLHFKPNNPNIMPNIIKAS